MSLRGDGIHGCADCGGRFFDDYRGAWGVCAKCDGVVECVEGCGRPVGSTGEGGRCAQCAMATAGGAA